MTAHFEIVRTDAGYHARFKGGNNEIVWTTETYQRKRDAADAIQLLGTHIVSLAGSHWHDIAQVDER